MVLIMNKKKVFLLLISLFMVSLFSSFSFAQEESGIGDSLKEVANTLTELFGFLPELITLEKLESGEKTSFFWAKFLIWVTLFTVIFFSSGFIFKDRKNIQIVISIAFSLIGTLGIPSAWIIGIFKTYTIAAGLLIFFIPAAGGLILAQIVPWKSLKVLVYVVLLAILFFIRSALAASDSVLNLGGSIIWINLLYGIITISLLWHIITMWDTGKALGDKFRDATIGKMGDAMSGGEGGGGGGGGGTPAERREQDEEEREAAGDRAQVKRLNEVFKYN